jgi:hypothetical protein
MVWRQMVSEFGTAYPAGQKWREGADFSARTVGQVFVP